LQDLYPEQNWDDALVRSVRHAQSETGHAHSLKRGLQTFDQQRQFFDWILKQYGRSSLQWFYEAPQDVLEKTGAASFIKQHHGGSLHSALVTIYPNHIWEPHLFQGRRKASARSKSETALLSAVSASPVVKKIPTTFGIIKKSLPPDLEALEALKQQLKITEPAQVYSLSWKVVRNAMAALDANHQELIKKKVLVQGAPVATMQALAKCWFPTFPWKPWQFRLVPRSFWMNPVNRKFFFDSFAEENKVDSMEQWYLVKNKQIIDYGGNGILSVAGNSISTALADVYPEHNWQPWKFHWTTTETWKIPAAVHFFFESLRGENPLDSLYTLASFTRRKPHGKKVLAAFKGSLLNALQTAYPQHSWDANRFEKQRKKKK
jgi:hypothetical protein